MKAIFKLFSLLTIIAFFAMNDVSAQHLPFQGKLLENGQPVNGMKAFTFSINQGAINWTETHSNVPVNNGLYAVVLGSITPLPANLFAAQTAINLSISVGGTPLDIVPIYPPIEADPTVPANLKDGVSWNEIGNLPPNILDDTSPTNELQNLELNDQTLSITSGNSVVLPEMSLPPQIQMSEPDTIYQTCPSQLTSSVNQEISSIWQSFKACQTSVLDTIFVQFANINATGIKLRIFPGEGISGQVMYEENFPAINFPALLQIQKIVLSNDLTMTEGTKYTFQVSGISSPIYASSESNAYNDGYCNFGADKDLKFKIVNKIFVPFQYTVNGTINANQFVGVDCIPQGVIVMWSGAIVNIPEGWSLCDGSNGTPDLRDRFVVGAKIDGSGVPMTNISGSLTQTGGITTLPNHSHTLAVGNKGGDISDGIMSDGTYMWNEGQDTYYNNTVKISTTIGGGGSQIINPYYALAFIMKL